MQSNSSTMRNIILSQLSNFTIGFADGLTVPFALTAGLSSLGSARLVIIAGLAELFSGSISMGLGAYLAARAEMKSTLSKSEVNQCPEDGLAIDQRRDQQNMETILARYGVCTSTAKLILEEIRIPDLEGNGGREDAPSKAWLAALVMGSAYFVGGIIPMIPYFVMIYVTHALFVSIGITAVILIIFGALKEWITAGRGYMIALRGAVETLVIGAAAAGSSYGIVRAIDSSNVA